MCARGTYSIWSCADRFNFFLGHVWACTDIVCLNPKGRMAPQAYLGVRKAHQLNVDLQKPENRFLIGLIGVYRINNSQRWF